MSSMTLLRNFLKSIFFFLIFFWSGSVFAVPPPDFIIQVASQLVSFFTIGIAILSGVYITLYQFIRWYILRYRNYFIYGGIFLILFVAGVWSYFADRWYRDQQIKEMNEQWLLQSKLHEANTVPESPTPRDSIGVSTGSFESTYTGWDSPLVVSGSVRENTGIILGSITKTDIPIFITNTELQGILKTQKEPLILDAREDIEYMIGNVPGSRHIRFADLKSSWWVWLPKDQPIYVICWSGMRGKEVALFLRSKWFQARYLEKWVDDWVSHGGLWRGEVKFSHAYPATRYSQVFSTKQALQKQKVGIILVDVRSKEKFEKNRIPGAVNIPLLDTPTATLATLFLQVPKKKEVITICDEYINCFAAKLVWIELEKRGAIFLGRYNKPWEIK